MANPDQCDRAQLDARIVKPFAVGGPPQLTLSVGGAGAIRPGEVPSLSWRVHNDCSDIGSADVKILFGGPPTQLYGTTVAIPVRSTVGEDLDPSRVMVPMSIASTFWSVGVKTLDLEVTGNGADPGPYHISVPLNVVPEPIDATWWTWDPPLGGVFLNLWKQTYLVTGSFNNRWGSF